MAIETEVKTCGTKCYFATCKALDCAVDCSIEVGKFALVVSSDFDIAMNVAVVVGVDLIDATMILEAGDLAEISFMFEMALISAHLM